MTLIRYLRRASTRSWLLCAKGGLFEPQSTMSAQEKAPHSSNIMLVEEAIRMQFFSLSMAALHCTLQSSLVTSTRPLPPWSWRPSTFLRLVCLCVRLRKLRREPEPEQVGTGATALLVPVALTAATAGILPRAVAATDPRKRSKFSDGTCTGP